MNAAIRIHASDNVAVALRPLRAGERFSFGPQSCTVRDSIPAGHKFALSEIGAGEPVVKYGCPIGSASRPIAPGEHVHTHNLASQLKEAEEYVYSPSFQELPQEAPRTFMGYRRADGGVGVRNEVWIIPTVGCVNGVARVLESAAQQLRPEGVDAVCAFPHPYGCSQLGDDLLRTQKALCGLIRHPNAAGVLVLGLGCENNRIENLKKVLGPVDEERVRFLQCQDCGSEIDAGLDLLRALMERAKRFRRTPQPASSLVVGLKCGGSDGFSGISANALLGRFTDKLCAQGGAAILTEVPEMFGAERLLMQRCRSEKLFLRTVGLIRDFKQYFLRYGERIDENPSPGNKDGGITTLAEKSLGCIQKGGSAPIEDVLSYGDPVRTPGLSLLEAPGNDLVSASALAVSGAHLVLFTTGRGTPLGCPVPTMKLSTNTPLFERKGAWIDFDAGPLLSGRPITEMTEQLFDEVLAVASGDKRLHGEAPGIRQLAIMKDGVIL